MDRNAKLRATSGTMNDNIHRNLGRCHVLNYLRTLDPPQELTSKNLMLKNIYSAVLTIMTKMPNHSQIQYIFHSKTANYVLYYCTSKAQTYKARKTSRTV